MPSAESMIATCAAREGVSPTVYWHTRTPREFVAASQAWVDSWAVPARVLIGTVTGTGGEKGRSGRRPGGEGAPTAPNQNPPRRSNLTKPRRDRHGRTVPQTVYDLRELLPLDKPWSPDNVQLIKRAVGPKTGRGPGR